MDTLTDRKQAELMVTAHLIYTLLKRIDSQLQENNRTQPIQDELHKLLADYGLTLTRNFI